MTELEKAIQLIEEAGGFVMMATDLDQTDNRDEYLAQLEMQEDAERDQLNAWQEQRKLSLEEMREDFYKMLGSKNFNITAVEDMVHGHGLDMDDLENMIHGSY